MTTNTVTTTTTGISLAKLIPCPANVRRTGAGAGIEALAASIQAHGLLQSIVVRPKLDGEGQASGRYEVVAGGRRLAALKLLAKQKRITKGTAIPSRVLDTDGGDGAEASLAENMVRQDMHPADQFEAFHGLHQGGIGIEDIAGALGSSPAQHRALAAQYVSGIRSRPIRSVDPFSRSLGFVQRAVGPPRKLMTEAAVLRTAR